MLIVGGGGGFTIPTLRGLHIGVALATTSKESMSS